MILTPASASCINMTSVSLSTPPAMQEAITKHSLQEHHHESFDSYVVGMNWGSVSRHAFRDGLFPQDSGLLNLTVSRSGCIICVATVFTVLIGEGLQLDNGTMTTESV